MERVGANSRVRWMSGTLRWDASAEDREGFLRAAGMLAAALMAVFCASASKAENVPPHVRRLSSEIAALEATASRVATKRERRKLLDRIETLKHQLGPFDAAGRRVRCRAMWHDEAYASLATEIERLSGRAERDAPTRSAVQAHLAARRVTAACLRLGWMLPPGQAKYQADAFGQYLAGNGAVLDELFVDYRRELTSAGRVPQDIEGRAEFDAAFATCAQGVAEMARSAEALESLPPDGSGAPGDVAEPLRGFLDGIHRLRRGLAELDEWQAARRSSASAGGGAGTGSDAPRSAPGAAMAPADLRQLQHVRRVLERLDGEAWAETRTLLEKYAAAVEVGYSIGRARPKARELLEHVARAAYLVDSLNRGRGVTDGYASLRAKEIVEALRLVGRPETRARGLWLMHQQWEADAFRRRVAALPISRIAAQGLVYARYQGQEAGLREGGAVDEAVSCLEVAAGRSGRGIQANIRNAYDRQLKRVVSAIDAAGKLLAQNPVSAAGGLDAVREQCASLEAIIEANHILSLADRAKCTTGRTTRIWTRVRRLADHPDSPARHREALEAAIGDIEELKGLRLPPDEHLPAVNRLVGSTYRRAIWRLGPDVERLLGRSDEETESLSVFQERMDKIRNRVRILSSVFQAVSLRAATTAYRFDKAPVSRLTAFSMPESCWKASQDAMDADLRAMLASYAEMGKAQARWEERAELWQEVYRPVAVAQRRTLARPAEEVTDVRVLARLERIAAADPPAEARNAWAVAFHLTGAAAAMTGGFDETARWHLKQIDACDEAWRSEPILPTPGG